MLSQRTGLGLNVKSPPRALSKEDALSVRVHSSSPLVPSSVLVSPVLRMHLVDSELGSPINPSGEPTTPLQTAPFDLSRRLKSAYAAEWEETLDVEEELGGLLSNRAVLLFELLQPPPSFQFYDERPDVFPGGRPARVAWGFLKLLRTKDQKPNLGRLQVQLYKWEEKASSALGALTRGPSSGATSFWIESKTVGASDPVSWSSRSTLRSALLAPGRGGARSHGDAMCAEGVQNTDGTCVPSLPSCSPRPGPPLAGSR